MPRLSHQTPKYRKHRASGQAIVELNGHRHYLGPHNSAASKQAYDRIIAEWLSAGRSPSYGRSEVEWTIIELIRDYVVHCKKYYGGNPRRGTYANIVRAMRPLKKLYGMTPAAEFGVRQYKAIRETLIGRDHCRKYVNEQMRMMVAAFRWAASEGSIPGVVVQDLAVIPGLRKGRSSVRESAAVRPVDLYIVEQTLPHLSSVVGAMVRFQMYTGSRPGEVCNLKAGDVDRTGDVWVARLTEHKTAYSGHDRTIYIGSQAQAVLAPFMLRGADDYCFSPAEAMQEMRDRRNAERKTPLSCGNRPGTNKSKKPARVPDAKYTTQSFGRAVSRGCELAFPHDVLSKMKGVDLTPEQLANLRAWNAAHRWAPNQLRHSLATRVRREFDIDAAKTLLGHQSIGITEVYAEQDHTRAIEVARQIG